jgi:glycosyltransferase involved in cell wall biosynthesis
MNCPPVLFLSQRPSHGDAHWRMVRPYVRLKEAGVDAAICWLGPDMMPTAPVAGRVVVLQRVIVGGSEDAARIWVQRLRDAGALAVVFEIDDDELTGANIDHLAATQPISQADRAELERQREALILTLRACDGATVSTDPLADVVRRYTDRPVITVPNAIDVEWFRNRLAPRAAWAEYLTIGWAGWRRPDVDLAPMAEAWARIARRYPDVRFVVAGHQPDVIYRQDIDLDRIIRLPIAALDDYPTMHQVTIGCCAVADSPFSRCKSNIKLWEYVLAGAAVVGTPLLYGDCMIPWHHAVAETTDQWETALSVLIEHADYRRLARHDLRAHVLAEHSLTDSLDRWANAYGAIVEAGPGVAV